MHPDIETLVGHRLGELPRPTEKMVALHLAACDDCRLVFHRLNGAMEAAPAAPADDVDGLMDRLRSWEGGENQAARTEAVKGRAWAAIASYLGKGAAQTLLQPVREDGRDLLSNAAPLLTTFLGRRAAGNLVSAVVDSAVVDSAIVDSAIVDSAIVDSAIVRL